MDQIRFSQLPGHTSVGQSFVPGISAEAPTTDPSVQLGVDEFVLSGQGTLATLQEPISLVSVMKDGNRSCSFVV